MKYSSLILMIFYSFSLGAVTVKEAGGSADNNQTIQIKTLPQPTEQQKKEHLKSLSTKGVFGPIRNHATTGGDFDGRTSDFEAITGIGAGDRGCKASSSERFIDHEIKMKNGEILRWIDVWGKDANNTQDMAVILYRQCLPAYGVGMPTTQFLVVEDMVTSSGDFIYSQFLNLGFEDNEQACKLMARIRFGSNSTCAGASDLRLYKFRAEFLENDLIFMDNMEDY